METGAIYLGGGRGRFTVWAPQPDSVEVEITAPGPRRLPLARLDRGYWQTEIGDLEPGTRYRFRLDGSLMRPDPASHYQPDGVHGDSSVVDHEAFAWSDAGWRCPALEQMVFYELHVGAFTPEGGFAAAADRLEEIAGLGVNAVELMPVAAFPGERNWGYDGVYPYSVQHSYGGPEGLKRLVDACHRRGLAVVLDVVYNHLGPEGNYLRDFGPYFTEAYRESFVYDWRYSPYHKRRRAAALSSLQRSGLAVEALEEQQLLVLQRRAGASSAYCLLSFNAGDQSLDLEIPPGSWSKALDSSLPPLARPRLTAARAFPRATGGSAERLRRIY